MNRFTRMFVGSALTLATGLAWAQTPPSPQRPLQVAIEDYPPYEYFENGEAKGIDVDVITTILTRLGIPHEIKAYPFARGWLMLKKGGADAAPSISYNKNREAYLYFTAEQRAFEAKGTWPSDYLWKTEYAFFINRRFEKSLHFESYAQLRKDGYRIGVLDEYTYHPGFLEAGLTFKQYVDPEQAIQALARGEIDLFPMDKTVAAYLINKQGLQDQIASLPKVIFSKPYLMVFSKQSTYPDLEGVMAKFYAELRSMRESGEYDSIRRRYLPEESPTVSAAVRPLLFVCEDWAPFEYMDGDTLKGIDVEVTDRIMKKLGLPYEIRIYPWSRAWLMASNGKADAVLSVSYKESREDALLYTDDQRKFAATGELPENHLWLSEYVFFVKRKFAETYTFESYDQLRAAGYRVGRNRDYTYDRAFMDANLPGTEFPDTKCGLEALVAEKIDLYPMDRTIGLATLKEMGLLGSVTFLPKPLFAKPYLVPFVKVSDYPNIEVVMDRFYRELRDMRDRGEIDTIRDHYLKGLNQ